jgi:hypothetical protein
MPQIDDNRPSRHHQNKLLLIIQLNGNWEHMEVPRKKANLKFQIIKKFSQLSRNVYSSSSSTTPCSITNTTLETIKHTTIDDKLRKMLCFMHTNFSLTHIQFIEPLDFLFSLAHEAFSISHAQRVQRERSFNGEREREHFFISYVSAAHNCCMCEKSQKCFFFSLSLSKLHNVELFIMKTAFTRREATKKT